jgi:hypothetical protein
MVTIDLVDRYTRVVLTLIATALIVIAVRSLRPGAFDALRPASANAQNIAALYEVTIPRSWGRLVSFSDKKLLLEGPDQSLRIVDVDGKAPDFPKVRVLIHWQ